MESEKLMQIFATVAAEPRYFLARYILDPHTPLTAAEINQEIEAAYPDIYHTFFAQRSLSYAWNLCAKGMASIGLVSKTTKPASVFWEKEEIDAAAVRATPLVNELEPWVHDWWGKEITLNFHASAFLTYPRSEKKEAIYYRALMLYLLSKNPTMAIRDISEELYPIYKRVTHQKRKNGKIARSPVYTHFHVYRHMRALEDLGAIALKGEGAQTYSDKQVTLKDLGEYVSEEFISPVFEKEPKNRKFYRSQLFELLHMHYTG